MEGTAQRILGTILPFAVVLVTMPMLTRIAPALGLVDHPGGRKAHAAATPLVGGIAIYLAVLVAMAAAGPIEPMGHWLAALTMLLAVGLLDDTREVSPRAKFVVEILACAVMIAWGGMRLTSVGDLIGWRPIGLNYLVMPLTVFAVIGVVNAVNMIDGMDGLAGSVSLVAFAWYAAVAIESGLALQAVICLAFCGALAGFLPFNLRLPWRGRAAAFLGDAGSLMIGFALGCLAIDLTQGANRSFPPICALWVVLLPLADCVSIMSRRLNSGRSPFVPDREHIHHYLLARGFSPQAALATLVAISALFGAVGYFGWRLKVPEPYLFWPFFFIYFGYHYWIKSAWKRVHSRGVEAGTAVARKS